MTDEYKPTMERFLGDVATHEMQIHLDQDVYRHLEFRQADKSWNHGFHIITTPGRLMISGDMGTWVFCRIPDMFNFFRSPSGEINLGYWAEKCINGTSGGSREAREYNGDVYKSRLIDSLDNYDLTDEKKAMVIEELNEIDFDDEHGVISQIRDFEVDLYDDDDAPTLRGYDTFQFQDVWEIGMTTYSYHFTWCLYAIAWAINQYDKEKSGEVRKTKINE